jgi:hypothetical protein
MTSIAATLTRAAKAASSAALLSAALAAPMAAAQPALAARLTSDAGRLVLIEPDGSRQDLSDKPGAVLTLGNGMRLRIDGVERQTDVRGQPVWLHRVSVADAAAGWRTLCAPHADGTRHLVFIAGRDRGDGTVQEDADAFAMSCTNGAQAKCLRFGYRPWGREAGGAPGQAAFNACVRIIRADYGGAGEPTTENGRLIDVYDDLGVQRPDRLPTQRFEAGWSEHGAVCVSGPRVPENITPAQIEARYPQLRGRVGEVCTEDFARAHGAILFNRSGEAR